MSGSVKIQTEKRWNDRQDIRISAVPIDSGGIRAPTLKDTFWNLSISIDYPSFLPAAV